MTSLAGTGPFAGSTIADLTHQLRTGRTRSHTLAEAALTAADTIGRALNCYVTVDHDGALRAADQADRELAAGIDRGPLHGIPVGVKDLIDTAGLRTTMGSRHFANHVPTTDAAVVIALRQAGAVIIGKTHTHQFAYGPTGDVAHTGPARNPHDPTRMTGGSSSGSAAAVAAGLLPAALGTDTGGSLRIPAALCGVVGMRPTTGILPTTGVFPLSTTLDTVGPIAATPADAALVWSALTGHNTTTTPTPPTVVARPTEPAAPASGLRIGVVRSDQLDRVVPSQSDALTTALSALTAAGSTKIDVPTPDLADWARRYLDILGPEARATHADRIADAPDDYEPEVRTRITTAATVPGWHYVAAQRLRAQLSGRHPAPGTDVLILPTVPIEAPPIGARNTDLGAGWTDPSTALLAFNSPWSLLGVPALSVPMPSNGLPASVQLIGHPGGEPQLLAIAALLASLVQ